MHAAWIYTVYYKLQQQQQQKQQRCEHQESETVKWKRERESAGVNGFYNNTLLSLWRFSFCSSRVFLYFSLSFSLFPSFALSASKILYSKCISHARRNLLYHMLFLLCVCVCMHTYCVAWKFVSNEFWTVCTPYHQVFHTNSQMLVVSVRVHKRI